jgi:hypothetical protein
MPYNSGSAMNPNGTFQTDGLDQIAMHNAQLAMQQQQYGNDVAHQNLMAQLAMRQLASGDQHFNAELADRQQSRQQGRQDAMNMFGAQADLTKAGWGHEDAIHSQDLSSREALARLMKEPSNFERSVYSDQKAEKQALMKMLGLSGDAQSPADPYSNSPDATARPQGPAAPMGGAPMLDQNKMQAIAAYNALTHGTQMPDFQRNGMEHDLMQMKMDEAKRGDASNRIQALLQAGQGDEARKIAAETGAPLPMVSPDALAADPAVGGALSEANAAGNDLNGKIGLFGSTGTEADSVKQAMARAVQIMVQRGVAPETARAYVLQKMRAISGKDGTHGLSIDGIFEKGGDTLAKLLDQGNF